jgi:hypothetical protein
VLLFVATMPRVAMLFCPNEAECLAPGPTRSAWGAAWAIAPDRARLIGNYHPIVGIFIARAGTTVETRMTAIQPCNRRLERTNGRVAFFVDEAATGRRANPSQQLAAAASWAWKWHCYST